MVLRNIQVILRKSWYRQTQTLSLHLNFLPLDQFNMLNEKESYLSPFRLRIRQLLTSEPIH